MNDYGHILGGEDLAFSEKTSISDVQEQIKVGTHGEDYGSWMSNPVFYVFGEIALMPPVLTVPAFSVFRIPMWF